MRRAPAARRIDLQGATVLPGLSDAHAHLAGIGERELTFNLEGTASLQELHVAGLCGLAYELAQIIGEFERATGVRVEV